jgi:hypothetical protein
LVGWGCCSTESGRVALKWLPMLLCMTRIAAWGCVLVQRGCSLVWMFYGVVFRLVHSPLGMHLLLSASTGSFLVAVLCRLFVVLWRLLLSLRGGLRVPCVSAFLGAGALRLLCQFGGWRLCCASCAYRPSCWLLAARSSSRQEQMASADRAVHMIMIIISGSACSTGGVHSQAWSTSGIGLGSKSGRGYYNPSWSTDRQ